MSTKTSKEYKAIKNYIHNELGLTKEDIINAIRSDIRKYVEECIKSGCLGCEREDGESVRYTIVNT